MSTDDSASAEMMHPEPATERKQGSLLRIVLVVLLVLAVIALIFDRQHRSAAEELNRELGMMLDSAPAREKPTIEAVHEKIGWGPSETYDLEQTPKKVEEYRFRRGLPWMNYTVYVYYSKTTPMRLYSVSLNQPEEF